jgi:hypothetical protein
MKKYEVLIVTKEYRYITVEAETENDAWDIAWDDVSNVVSNTDADDFDTEVFVNHEFKPLEA